MVRDDIPNINETLTMKVHTADFLVILGGSKTYTLHWTHHIPQHVDIYSDGLEKYVSETYSMVCPPVRRDIPQALASGLATVQAGKLCSISIVA